MGNAVLVLGHGEMGQSMEYLLGGRHALATWERNLADGTENVPLETAVARRDFVIFALPAAPHGEIAARIRPHLAPHCICLSIAKGLDASGRTPAQALAGALGPERSFALVYGPMIAEELRSGRPGFADVATARRETFDRIRALFAGTGLFLRHTDDVPGASWCAVLKNVYVPLVGAAEEAGLGDNVRGCLAAAVLAEMSRVAEAMGGRATTALGLAGLGDLVTTATSAGSRHRQVGRDLEHCAPGDSCGSGTNAHSEGLHTLATIEQLQLLDLGAYPLMGLVRAIVREPRHVATRIRPFLEQMFAAQDQGADG